MARDIPLIWAFGKSEYFFGRGWTTTTAGSVICPSGNRLQPLAPHNRGGHQERATLPNFSPLPRSKPILSGWEHPRGDDGARHQNCRQTSQKATPHESDNE